MLYEVVLEQRFFNQQCINRWNYTSSGVASDIVNSLALITAMGFVPDEEGDYPPTLIFSKLGLLQANEVEYIQVSARAIYDVTDFYSLAFPPNTHGSAGAGNAVSPADAYGLRTNRIRQDIARGTKRFVGVSEGAVGNGGVLNSAGQSLLDDLAVQMSAAVVYPFTDSEVVFTPVIVSKEKYETPSGRYAYRYYPTLAQQQLHLAENPTWEIYTTTRTQTSRQYGRGS